MRFYVYFTVSQNHNMGKMVFISNGQHALKSKSVSEVHILKKTQSLKKTAVGKSAWVKA